MGFRLVPNSVTLNNHERRNGPYFALFHRIRVRYVVVKQLSLLGLSRFQNLLLTVYDHSNTNRAIIQRLFWAKQTLITPYDGRRCIDDYVHILA